LKVYDFDSDQAVASGGSPESGQEQGLSEEDEESQSGIAQEPKGDRVTHQPVDG
jgi:hypothetical protein